MGYELRGGGGGGKYINYIDVVKRLWFLSRLHHRRRVPVHICSEFQESLYWILFLSRKARRDLVNGERLEYEV